MPTLPQRTADNPKPKTRRTLLNLDEDAYLRLKVEAAKPGKSQSEIVSAALKQILPAVQVEGKVA